MVLSSWHSTIARVHPVHTMNADSAPGGRQPSDQANRLNTIKQQKSTQKAKQIYNKCAFCESSNPKMKTLPITEFDFSLIYPQRLCV